MKWIRFAMVCALAAGWAGCDDGGGGGGGGGDAALIGNWRMTSMSVNGGGFFTPAGIGWDVQLRLAENGNATVIEVWQGDTESASGGWTAADGQLRLSADWYNWTGAYTAAGNSFRLNGVANYDGEGNTGSFVFTRI